MTSRKIIRSVLGVLIGVFSTHITFLRLSNVCQVSSRLRTGKLYSTVINVHRPTCLCGASYIGQKQRNLINRTEENNVTKLVSLQTLAS